MISHFINSIINVTNLSSIDWHFGWRISSCHCRPFRINFDRCLGTSRLPFVRKIPLALSHERLSVRQDPDVFYSCSYKFDICSGPKWKITQLSIRLHKAGRLSVCKLCSFIHLGNIGRIFDWFYIVKSKFSQRRAIQ